MDLAHYQANKEEHSRKLVKCQEAEKWLRQNGIVCKLFRGRWSKRTCRQIYIQNSLAEIKDEDGTEGKYNPCKKCKIWQSNP